MPRLIELRAGRRFTRLVVVRRARHNGRKAWLCRCDCGNPVKTFSADLLRDRVKSCGCLHIDQNRSRATHRATATPEYQIWADIIRRCSKPSHHAWADYGGRGIKVCKRWQNFEHFIKDVGPRPTPAHSLDRRKVNGGYSPANCRWATRKEQARNKRNNLIVIFRGRAMTFAEAVELTGIRYKLAYARLHSGWPLEMALTPGRHPRSKGPGAPTATIAALGRAAQAAGLTVADIEKIARRRRRTA
jgi:hypothetical protein